LEIDLQKTITLTHFIACSEIENRGVLEDLIKQPKLIPKDYGIIHFDSPDKRGIDGFAVPSANLFVLPHTLIFLCMSTKKNYQPICHWL
jgi:hypothetical protein